MNFRSEVLDQGQDAEARTAVTLTEIAKQNEVLMDMRNKITLVGQLDWRIGDEVDLAIKSLDYEAN